MNDLPHCQKETEEEPSDEPGIQRRSLNLYHQYLYTTIPYRLPMMNVVSYTPPLPNPYCRILLTLGLQLQALHLNLNLHHKPLTLNPKPYILNPKS